MTASSIAPVAQIDHAVLDVILSHLERRYGLDPRIDRAYRIVVGDRVDLLAVDPRAGLVHGDSGRSYWATVGGFCECADAERVSRCKHSLAVLIVDQLAAVERSKATQGDVRATIRATDPVSRSMPAPSQLADLTFCLGIERQAGTQ